MIVEGRAPIWRYGMALHRLHASPVAAVALYDPRLGAVVVATHSQEWFGAEPGGSGPTDEYYENYKNEWPGSIPAANLKQKFSAWRR